MCHTDKRQFSWLTFYDLLLKYCSKEIGIKTLQHYIHILNGEVFDLGVSQFHNLILHANNFQKEILAFCGPRILRSSCHPLKANFFGLYTGKKSLQSVINILLFT